MKSLLIILLVTAFAANTVSAQTDPPFDLSGKWTISLAVDETTLLPFDVEFRPERRHWIAHLINGAERITVPRASLVGKLLTLEIPHYDSKLTLHANQRFTEFTGEWVKRRGKDQWATVPAKMVRRKSESYEHPNRYVGRWAVQFDGDEDPAVAIFEKADDTNAVTGTFLTTTGDYRYLAGGVADGRLILTCFDGAHAFRFEASSMIDQSIKGSFHSGNWWQTQWSAVRDNDAQLPDAFQQTVWTDQVDLKDLKFPMLNGEIVTLDDPRFAGKCRIIEVFGSWCPNCHDAGEYLSELHQRYSDQGLSIVGLAFELTGEFDRDVQQVKRYMERTNTKYPILIAGTSDKKLASEVLPVLDKIRSYPTMIFLDGANRVKAIYTGFSGPATGAAHEKLRKQFEQIISATLDE